MWTTFAADCITSTLFMTACAPNFLAVSFIEKIAKVHVTYAQWMMGSLPFALPLLLLLPLLVYVIYPPEIKRSTEASEWAGRELAGMGAVSRREITLAAIVVSAILMWVFGGELLDPALTAFCGIALMLVLGVVTWEDMAKNHSAWTTIMLLATLVTLADGLGRAGFIPWFAHYVAAHVGGLSPTVMVMALVAIYFFSHYMFASLTAHTTAMMPLMLGAAISIPGVPVATVSLALALTTGLMGVISPYATGPGLPYYNSGYIPPAQFWKLGAVFGVIFVAALLLVGVPLLAMR
jgi:L-tartrate/succinate antiporter